MAIADANTVDVAAQDADGTYLLVMIETRPWGTSARQREELRNKIEAYARFALGGQMARLYPETAGQRVVVQLNCAEPPNADVQTVLEAATRQLERLGIGFRVKVLAALRGE